MDVCADLPLSPPPPAQPDESPHAARPPGPAAPGPALFTRASHRGDLVAAYPELAATCDALQFGDRLALGEWSSAPEWALLRLARAARPPRPAPAWDWSLAEIPELISDIERHHHQPLRDELSRLAILLGELVLCHPGHGMGALAARFARLQQSALAHLFYEEHVVFPRLRRIEAASRGQLPDAGAVAGITGGIRTMIAGHDTSATDLAEVQALAARVPQLADDPDLQAVRAGLDAMAADLAVHIAKEDGYLMPAAIFAEEQLQARHESTHARRRRRSDDGG